MSVTATFGDLATAAFGLPPASLARVEPSPASFGCARTPGPRGSWFSSSGGCFRAGSFSLAFFFRPLFFRIKNQLKIRSASFGCACTPVGLLNVWGLRVLLLDLLFSLFYCSSALFGAKKSTKQAPGLVWLCLHPELALVVWGVLSSSILFFFRFFLLLVRLLFFSNKKICLEKGGECRP